MSEDKMAGCIFCGNKNLVFKEAARGNIRRVKQRAQWLRK